MSVYVPLGFPVISAAPVGEGLWCQAGIGSCVGQRHMFRKNESYSTLRGSHFDGTIRFADWDSDGDTDVLVGDGGSIWFYERLSNDTFSKHELVKLRAQEGPAVRLTGFEVADWDGH